MQLAHFRVRRGKSLLESMLRSAGTAAGRARLAARGGGRGLHTSRAGRGPSDGFFGATMRAMNDGFDRVAAFFRAAYHNPDRFRRELITVFFGGYALLASSRQLGLSVRGACVAAANARRG